MIFCLLWHKIFRCQVIEEDFIFILSNFSLIVLLVIQKYDKRKVTLCFFAGENFNVALIFHHMHPKPTKKRKPRHPAASAFFGGIY